MAAIFARQQQQVYIRRAPGRLPALWSIIFPADDNLSLCVPVLSIIEFNIEPAESD